MIVIFKKIKEKFIIFWNKIFGNTIFGIYYDSKPMKIKNKKSKKKVSKASLINVEEKKETNVLDVDLVDDNATKGNKKKLRQYTKKIVDILVIMSCLWITWSYILSTIAVIRFQDVQVLSSLSEEVCRTILGVVIAYALKSFCESFAEAKQSLKEKEFYEDIWNKSVDHDDIDDNNDNNIVG